MALKDRSIYLYLLEAILESRLLMTLSKQFSLGITSSVEKMLLLDLAFCALVQHYGEKELRNILLILNIMLLVGLVPFVIPLSLMAS